jgi:cytochrome c
VSKSVFIWVARNRFVGQGDRLYVGVMVSRSMILAIAAALTLVACSPDDKQARRRAAGPNPSVAALARVANAAAGAKLFTRCSACHSIGRGAPDFGGPNLFGVMGQEIGQNSSRFAYTAALQRVGGRWTPERMDAWLADPRGFAPGTAMGIAGLSDPLDRADVIAYLQTKR